MQHSRHHSRQENRRPAFTLVELMISIALSLFLLLGINAVFRMSAQTVGMGMAQSLTSRDLRAAQTAMEFDMGNHYSTPYGTLPALILQSMNQVAFRDAVDERSDAKYVNESQIDKAQEDALWVDDGTGNLVSPPRLGNSTPPAPSILLNNRNHRVDIFSFFANGFYRRQTADSAEGTYQSAQTSNSAYITYGHLRQPDSNTANWGVPKNYMQLGIAWNGGNTIVAPNSNPENNYASKWLLGRRVMLLVIPNSAGRILDPSNVAQQYYSKVKPPVNQENLTPLAYASPSGSAGPIQDSQLDLAGTSLNQFKGYVEKVVWPNPANTTTNQTWYLPLLTNQRTSIGGLRPDDAFRYACKPWVSRSTNAAQMTFEEAMTAPLFVRGCSQFCVEFAGDYVTQNDLFRSDGTPSTIPSQTGQTGKPTDFGVATAAQSDGVLDFDLVMTSQSGSGSGKVPVKKVRWYGLTRSLDGGADETPKSGLLPSANLVHPVNWHLKTVTTPSPFPALPFEKVGGNAFPQSRPKCVDAYTCAWSPYEMGKLNDSTSTNAVSNPPTPLDSTFGHAYPLGFMPWMVRITMRVDDPNGRLAEGQTVEWIFNMPRVR